VATLPDATGVGYLTVEVSGGCAKLQQVQATTEAISPVPDEGFDYPLGWWHSPRRVRPRA